MNFTILYSVQLTGVGNPASSPRRTTAPLRASISVGFPARMSWRVEDSWLAVGGSSLSWKKTMYSSGVDQWVSYPAASITEKISLITASISSLEAPTSARSP
jgi:hypothetical protein